MAPTHDELQATLEDQLQTEGWLVFHDRAVNMPGAHVNIGGFPDLCCVHPRAGKVLFIEVKVPPDKLRDDQEAWCLAIEEAERRSEGWVTYFLVTPENLDRHIERIHELRHS